MHTGLLKPRTGFTLVEVLIALTLTAVLGAAVMGAFVSQSQFFDKQEKVGAARAVSQGGLNMMMSELRMMERSGGVEAAESDSVTLNVPYAMGLYCEFLAPEMRLSLLPVDSMTLADAGYSGFAFRTSNTTYQYEDRNTTAPTPAASTTCTLAGVAVVTDGQVLEVENGQSGLKTGTPVILYQRISYVFRESTSVPGRLALYRRVHDTKPVVEELVAPFAANAGFGYFLNDAVTAQASVAAGSLDQITGLELTLDGLSERPNGDGTFQSAPYTTSVFFKNR